MVDDEKSASVSSAPRSVARRGEIDDDQYVLAEAAQPEARHQTAFLRFGFEPQEAHRVPFLGLGHIFRTTVFRLSTSRQPASGLNGVAEAITTLAEAAG